MNQEYTAARTDRGGSRVRDIEVTCRGGQPALHCAGKPEGTKIKTQPPTADLRVRKAVQATIDTNAASWSAQVAVDADFDLAVPWSFSMSDDDGAYNSIFRNFNSPGLTLGYANADMDAAIDALRIAKNDDDKRAAYKRISEFFTRDAPGAVLASRKIAIAHSPRVQGFQQSATAIVFFDKVWLAAS